MIVCLSMAQFAPVTREELSGLTSLPFPTEMLVGYTPPQPEDLLRHIARVLQVCPWVYMYIYRVPFCVCMYVCALYAVVFANANGLR